ncbi:MAG: glycosyltransferase family 39 protein, partial [Acidobacteriota bacterium]
MDSHSGATSKAAQLLTSNYSRGITYCSATIFILLAVYFGWLCNNLTVHYYDSFQDLNSAKAFVGLDSYYDYTRPPFPQLLLAQIMLIYRISESSFWLERAPYFFILIINAFAVISVWRLLRAGLGREIALIMTVLLVLNRVVFHYLPFVLADLLGMGLVAALALDCYNLAHYKRIKYAILTGCWLGLALSTKQQLAMLCLAPPLFLFTEWIVREEGRLRFRFQLQQIGWLVLIAICSATVFLLLYQIALWLVPAYRSEPLFSH